MALEFLRNDKLLSVKTAQTYIAVWDYCRLKNKKNTLLCNYFTLVFNF